MMERQTIMQKNIQHGTARFHMEPNGVGILVVTVALVYPLLLNLKHQQKQW